MAVAERVVAIDDHGRRVQAMFSAIAHGYDRANRLMSLGTDVRWRRRAIDRLLGDDDADATILDLCAGTLDSSLEIHARFPAARIVAGDFSAGMIETGTRRLRGSARERITPRIMDAHQLPFADASLDAIFCAFGVRNLSDPERATREQARCLKPGGRLVVLDFFRPTEPVPRVFHSVYSRTVLPAIGWACTGNLAAYRYLPRSIASFSTTPRYCELLARADFDAISARPLTFGVASLVEARRAGTGPERPRSAP